MFLRQPLTCPDRQIIYILATSTQGGENGLAGHDMRTMLKMGARLI